MLGNLIDKHEPLTQRIFEILPGVLLWAFLLSPIWGGNFNVYIIVINTYVVLAVYWLYKSFITTLGVIVGYERFRIARKKDWLNECNLLDKSKILHQEELPKNGFLPKQLIVIANYGENYDVLSRSIRGLINQNYPKELIYLSVSIEERKAKKDEDYAKRGEYLKRDFGEFFGDRLMFFVHPDNLAGEAIGAAANRTWGTKNAVMELEKRGEDIKEFLVTAPDGDLVFDKQYLAAVAYKWLTSEKRNQKFYQTAVYTFNNNYWEVPMMIRVLMIALTIPTLGSSVFEKNKRETWSCFTLNLNVMKEVNYWDTSLAIDDTTFYWRPYNYFNGDWFCEVFFIPLSADAIYDPNYIKNHKDQYKQYVRWGWGVITVPLAMKVLLKNKKISTLVKLEKIFHLFEVFVLGKVISVLLAFGLPVLFFLYSSYNKLNISLSASQTISFILSFSIVLLVPTTIYKILLIPPRPTRLKKWRYYLTLLIEIPINLVVLYSFSFIPFVEATTRMMLGQQHTKTIKWSEKQLAK